MKVAHATTGALFALLAIMPLSAWSKPAISKPISKPAESLVAVVAHLPMPGFSADALLLLDNGDERYLYAEQAANQNFAFVNVTDPSQPWLMKRSNAAMKSFGVNLRFIGGGLALTVAAEAAAPSPNRGTRTVRVLDLSDPSNPRIVFSFPGVTSSLVDEARSLVYISNNEGLWILQNNQALAAAAPRHACTSSDALRDGASCD